MHTVFAPQAVLHSLCEIDETESRHASSVLRLKVGDEVHVLNGKGELFKARIEVSGKKSAAVFISDLLESKPADTPQLHIAIAPPKNMERLEWFAEKATEMGVTEITPLICAHSERRKMRIDRLEKIVVSAVKQSRQLWLPKVNEEMSFTNFVTKQKQEGQQFIAYCEEEQHLLRDVYQRGQSAVVLIGPEGDFTHEEVVIAKSHGYQTVSLGKSRLRLETAGIMAAAVFNILNQ